MTDELCPETGKPHVPDWNSVQMVTDKGATHGASFLDVNCKDCGQSGCCAAVEHTDVSPIDW
ncbi:MAG: hypothetical protein GY759_09055 [Chloroflexi bacterium]|nr:hypothetical protein [Chloroflexota bacterium]